MKVLMVVICLIAMGTGVFIGLFMEDFYSGKETFYTEQEYTQFKEAISNPEISITTIQSLSSKPPIVVNFQIRIPNNEVFPYGEKDVTREPGGYVLAVFSFGALCFALFYKPKQAED